MPDAPPPPSSPATAPPDEAVARRAAFRLLFGSLLVVGFGNSMLFALLPPLGRQIGMPEASIGAIFALSALIWVFASPTWGRFSDRAGRKPIVALGLAAYGLSMALFAGVAFLGQIGVIGATMAFVGLMLARAIFGAVGSAASPAAQAYVADRTRPAERTTEIAALTAAFALGSAIGPGVCALLAAQLGLLFPIWGTAVLAALSAAAIWRFLPEPEATKPAPVGNQRFSDTFALALDGRVSSHIVYGVGLSLITGTLSQTFAFFTMDRLGVSGEAGAESAAAGFMVQALALLAAQMAIVPRLALSPRQLMTWGALLVALGVGIQMMAPNLGALLFAQLIQGLGFGLARPGFAGGASMAVSPTEQGAVAGLVVAANGAGFVISPLAGGLAYQELGMNAPLIITVALLLGMAAFAWRSRGIAAPGWRGEAQ